jgi:hypothetical protein
LLRRVTQHLLLLPRTPLVSEKFTGRRVIHILKEHQKLTDLDLWPRDTVFDVQLNYLGTVGPDGKLVDVRQR